MIEFYNVKKKKKVSIDKSKVSRRAFKRMSRGGLVIIRYSLRSEDEDGTKLSKFCSKRDYDSI